MTSPPLTIDSVVSDELPAGEPGATKGRLVAFVAILMQVGVLLAWTDDYLTTVALAVLAWSAALGIRIPLRQLLTITPTYVALSALVVTKSAVAPFEVDPSRNYINSALAFDLALFCILTQIGVLFGYVGKRLPIWLPVFSVMALLLLSDVTVHSRSERLSLLAANVVCAISAAMIFRLSRTPSPTAASTHGIKGWFLPLLAIIISATAGGGAALMLLKYERSIDSFLARSLGVGAGRSARTGFSGEGAIGAVADWQTAGTDSIALRIFADSAPGYVSGRVFDRFNGLKWQRTWQIRPVSPTRHVVFESEFSREKDSAAFVLNKPKRGRTLFSVANIQSMDPESESDSDATNAYREFEIWPSKYLPATLFKPEGCNFTAVESTSLPIDEGGNADLDRELQGIPFAMYDIPSGPVGSPTSAELQSYLSTTDSTQTEQLAEALFRAKLRIFGPAGADHLTTTEKCTRIEQFFHSNYSYKLGGVQMRRQDDRVAAFLEKNQSGHCEFFASSTVMLLRSVGVPARYVTGFLVQERNPVGDYWIARDRDAHAWVEAWDETERRWRVVESTPAAGVPQQIEAGHAGQFRDGLYAVVRQWATSLKQKNIQQALSSRAADLLSPRLLLFIGAVAGSFAVILAYRQRRSAVRDDLIPYHAALDRVALALKSKGYQRRSNETLQQFASRVQASTSEQWAADASKWLAEYSRLRFRRHSTSADDVEGLTDRARKLARSIRVKSPRGPAKV